MRTDKRYVRFHNRLLEKLLACKNAGVKAVVWLPGMYGPQQLRVFDIEHPNELGENIPLPPFTINVWDVERFCQANNLVLVGKIVAAWYGGSYGTVLSNIVPYK